MKISKVLVCYRACVQEKGYGGFVVKGHHSKSQERRGLGYLTNVVSPQTPLVPFYGL
jgi:hypothetical protein